MAVPQVMIASPPPWTMPKRKTFFFFLMSSLSYIADQICILKTIGLLSMPHMFIFTESATRPIQSCSRKDCIFVCLYVSCPLPMQFILRSFIGQHWSHDNCRASHWFSTSFNRFQPVYRIFNSFQSFYSVVHKF